MGSSFLSGCPARRTTRSPTGAQGINTGIQDLAPNSKMALALMRDLFGLDKVAAFKGGKGPSAVHQLRRRVPVLHAHGRRDQQEVCRLRCGHPRGRRPLCKLRQDDLERLRLGRIGRQHQCTECRGVRQTTSRREFYMPPCNAPSLRTINPRRRRLLAHRRCLECAPRKAPRRLARRRQAPRRVGRSGLRRGDSSLGVRVLTEALVGLSDGRAADALKPDSPKIRQITVMPPSIFSRFLRQCERPARMRCRAPSTPLDRQDCCGQLKPVQRYRTRSP